MKTIKKFFDNLISNSVKYIKLPIKLSILGIIVVFMTISFSGCNSEQNFLKIGIIMPQDNNGNGYGNEIVNGAMLYIEDNSTILDNEITLENINSKTESTESAYKKLIEDKDVYAILGLNNQNSITGLNVENIKNTVNIPVIAPTIDNQIDYDNVQEFGLDEVYQGEKMAEFSVNGLKLRTVAILYNADDSSSTKIAEVFKDKLSQIGGEVIYISAYNNSTTDFTAKIKQIKALNPQLIFLPDKAQIVSKIADTIYKIDVGIGTTLLGIQAWEGIENYISDYEAIYESYYISDFSLDDSRSEVQNFINSYQAKYGAIPTRYSALGYDCMSIIKKAIEESVQDDDPLDRNLINEKLKTIIYDGLTGKIDLINKSKTADIITFIDGEKVLYSKVEN